MFHRNDDRQIRQARIEIIRVYLDDRGIFTVGGGQVDGTRLVVDVLDGFAVTLILFFAHKHIRGHFVGLRKSLELCNTTVAGFVGKANEGFADTCITTLFGRDTVRRTDGQTDVRQVRHSIISFNMV